MTDPATTNVTSLLGDGTVTARISFDASSVNTKNKQRDNHLRSADFFHADKHRHAVLTVTSARPAGRAELECRGSFEAAGHVVAVTFTANVEEATAQAVVLTAELAVDRAALGMTWSPLHIASMTARGTVRALHPTLTSGIPYAAGAGNPGAGGTGTCTSPSALAVADRAGPAEPQVQPSGLETPSDPQSLTRNQLALGALHRPATRT